MNTLAVMTHPCTLVLVHQRSEFETSSIEAASADDEKKFAPETRPLSRGSSGGAEREMADTEPACFEDEHGEEGHGAANEEEEDLSTLRFILEFLHSSGTYVRACT